VAYRRRTMAARSRRSAGLPVSPWLAGQDRERKQSGSPSTARTCWPSSTSAPCAGGRERPRPGPLQSLLSASECPRVTICLTHCGRAAGRFDIRRFPARAPRDLVPARKPRCTNTPRPCWACGPSPRPGTPDVAAAASCPITRRPRPDLPPTSDRRGTRVPGTGWLSRVRRAADLRGRGQVNASHTSGPRAVHSHEAPAAWACSPCVKASPSHQPHPMRPSSSVRSRMAPGYFLLGTRRRCSSRWGSPAQELPGGAIWGLRQSWEWLRM
jgi:hypothetical protein